MNAIATVAARQVTGRCWNDRYSGLVFSTAQRTLHRTGETEILQDIFYQVWCTAERSIRPRGSFAGWLLVAARNRAISNLRRLDGHTDGLDENAVSLSVDIECTLRRTCFSTKCARALASLPDGQREALEWAHFEGMPDMEVAQKTGQFLGIVKTRLRGAMQALKRVLR